MKFLWPDHGEWKLINPMVPTPLFNLLNTGRGIGTKTFEVDNAFPPDDLWFD